MENEKKRLRPYHGVFMLALAGICVFFIGPMLGMKLGLYGTLLNELLLLAVSVLVVLIFRGDVKEVFPMKKPKMAFILGTILLWVGTFLTVMILTLALSYFFPAQVIGVSQSLGAEFASVSFGIAFVIVSISPAICEEAVFRGVVLNSFRGARNKWIAIVLTGVIFGAFHGSIWRFVPTAVLGIMLGYIVVETGNIWYSCLFHAINNLAPLVSLFALKGMQSSELYEQQMAMMTDGIPLLSIGVYIMYGAAVPFLIYIGNYLIHKGQPGYAGGLFERKDRMKFLMLLIVSAAFAIVGIMIIVCGIITQPELFQI